MKLKLKVPLTVLAVAALSAAVLAPVAAAGGPGTMMGGGTGTGTTPGPGTPAGTMMGSGTAADPQPGPGSMMGGTWDGSGAWGATGMWGMMDSGMTWLADNPAAMQAWLAMRTEHQQDMQAWYDTYKADLTSSAAQQALHDLWTAHWNDMQSFMQKHASGAGWTVPAMGMWNGWQMGAMMGGGTWDAGHMWGSGYGASWMMGDPAGMGQWLALRGRQVSAANVWMQHYGSAAGSPAAQAAMKALSALQRGQVKRFYKQHHLPTGSAMMRAATGGWMGLGGMWGGFGW